MQPRRQQPPIAIRSARAAELLKRHTADGRSQAQVIEAALEALPDPHPPRDPFSPEEVAARLARIEVILARIPPGSFRPMAEFDADEYDERGNCR